MSVVLIRAALESALAAMSPALATAWENVSFTPVPGTPYQRVNMLLAQPDNSEFGPNYFERGILQITLSYPQGDGPAATAARAQLLRTTFKRGTTYASGGVAVLITDTPEVTPAQNDTDRFEQPVRVRFRANVTA